MSSSLQGTKQYSSTLFTETKAVNVWSHTVNKNYIQNSIQQNKKSKIVILRFIQNFLLHDLIKMITFSIYLHINTTIYLKLIPRQSIL
jgi:hypothetical protein